MTSASSAHSAGVYESFSNAAATRRESAVQLGRLPEILKLFPEPHPIVVLGGRAFLDHQLPENVPAVYLNGTPAEIVTRIEQLMMGE